MGEELSECARTRVNLVAYCFGALEGEARDRVDAHLPGCTACVRDFVALRRALDGVDANAPRPSPVSHARLRAKVVARMTARRRVVPALVVAGACAAAAIATAVLTTGERDPADSMHVDAPGPEASKHTL